VSSSQEGKQASWQTREQSEFRIPFSVFENLNPTDLKVSDLKSILKFSFQTFSTYRGINRCSDESQRCPFTEHDVIITAHARFDKILFTQLGDDAVVYDIENNAYLSMNATFSAIFQGIQAERDVEAIISGLLDEYDIDEETCRAQVMNSIEILKDKGFIS
jgi:hypothetical protein